MRREVRCAGITIRITISHLTKGEIKIDEESQCFDEKRMVGVLKMDVIFQTGCVVWKEVEVLMRLLREKKRSLTEYGRGDEQVNVSPKKTLLCRFTQGRSIARQ